jgi:hypothetical protein
MKRNPGSMSQMKIKTLVVTLAVWVAAGAICFAASNPQMGTWKLNEAKSKITPGTAKNTMVVYKSSMMGKVKIIVDGVDGMGKPAHNEWTGKFDGKDYPVTGDPTTDVRAYKQIDDRKIDITNKKGGKIVNSGHVVLAADGKSRTLTVTGKTPKGKQFKNTAVYDKQ